MPTLGGRTPEGFTTYIPRRKFLKERARRETTQRPGRGSPKTSSPKPFQPLGYEYPPRWEPEGRR